VPQPQVLHDGAPRDRRRLLFEAASLALLLEAPCHGYMLYRRFVELIGDAAAPRKQTIYDVIERLGRAGFIEAEIEPVPDQWRQPRKRLLVTSAGRVHLTEFVTLGFGAAEDRDEFRVRLRCAGALRDFDALQGALATRTEELLRRQQQMPAAQADLPLEPVLLSRRLVERRALMELQSELEWLEWAQAMVTAAAGNSAVT
jgi:DNA-binding PadR family transcriptional regulator